MFLAVDDAVIGTVAHGLIPEADRQALQETLDTMLASRLGPLPPADEP